MHTAFAKIDAEAKASVEAMLATGEPSYRKGVLRQPSNKWRTTSAWQKSIRQGHADIAKMCCRALYKHDPKYVWYRLPIIAAEDVGWGNPDAVRDILYAARQKWSEPQGLHLALGLTERLAFGPKSRSWCDAIVQARMDPAYEKHRVRFKLMSREVLYDELLSMPDAPNIRPPVMETMIWQALFATKLPRGEPLARLLMGCAAAEYDPFTIWLMKNIRSKGCEGLFAGVGASKRLLDLDPDAKASTAQRDQRQTEIVANPVMIGALPAYAFDLHCYEGKTAMAYFRKACAPMRELTDKTGAAPKNKLHIAGNLVFYAEGGLLSPELQYAGNDRLWYDSMIGCQAWYGQTDPEEVVRGIQIVLEHYDLLNKIRAKLLADK